jgi:hypothetical protein
MQRLLLKFYNLEIIIRDHSCQLDVTFEVRVLLLIRTFANLTSEKGVLRTKTQAKKKGTQLGQHIVT